MMDTNRNTDAEEAHEVVVKLREMPLGHALRRANLAALLLPDSQAEKKEVVENGTRTAEWQVTAKPVHSLLAART